jgi:hypothetical protein
MHKLILKVFKSFGLIVIYLMFGNCPAITQIKTENVGNTPALQECSKNSDPMYDRETTLKKLDHILKRSIPYYNEFPLMGYFVFDLTDPSNSYKSRRNGLPEKGCINFINNHVYHFSANDWSSSKSQIAILEDGKMKVFNSINCKGSKAKLDNVLRYVSENLKDRNKDDTITRLKNYRRYGLYQTVDSTDYSCGNAEISPNSDKLYSRRRVLEQFLATLIYSRPGPLAIGFPYVFIEESKAVGFFVYDLTDPSNKQTSLLERVEFKNNHVYHFAHIDAHFSFSNIAILEDGKLKIFKTINCKGKGDSLEDVIVYLNEKLKDDKNKDEIIRRVKNYREYGIYASFNGLSTPQCEELVKP